MKPLNKEDLVQLWLKILATAMSSKLETNQILVLKTKMKLMCKKNSMSEEKKSRKLIFFFREIVEIV